MCVCVCVCVCVFRIGELVEFLDQVWHDQSRGSSGCLDKNTSTGRHSSINNSHQSVHTVVCTYNYTVEIRIPMG